MDQTTTDDSDVMLPRAAIDQFCYHVRMAAVFGVAGDVSESASEAVLAWAILDHLWPGAPDAALTVSRELIGQELAGASEAHRLAATRRAEAQALDLQGHFVTVGMHDEANLYATVADRLDAVVTSIVADA